MDSMQTFPYPQLLQFFEVISRIPRESGKESRICDYLCSFARANALFYTKDDFYNVLIRRNATVGYEDHPVIALQGHMDMVCEKRPDITHDFDNDPILFFEKDGWLCTNGTTLGADDGVALSYMLSLLCDKEYQGPALECLFTSDEERGMSGARNFDYSQLKARHIINLDSDCEQEVILGCAGGNTVQFYQDYSDFFTAPEAQPLRQAVRIRISGLASGHSGGKIHKGLQNAILLCASLLFEEYNTAPFGLIRFQGGGRANVIPKECEAVIAVTDAKACIERLQAKVPHFYTLLCQADRQMKIHIDRVGVSAPVLSFHKTGQLFRFLSLLPNGVVDRVADSDFVLTSSNLGALTIADSKLCATLLSRSMRTEELERLYRRFSALAFLCELHCERIDSFPPWEGNLHGAFADAYAAYYESATNLPLRRRFIHAGLECGYIQRGLGTEVQILSIGPNTKAIHTPNEALSLSSFATIYKILKGFLATL